MEANLEMSPSTPPPPASVAPAEAKSKTKRPNSPATGAGREARREKSAPNPDAAAAVSSVLGNGDLLREILLRLDFPTCLVRAAAVSRTWLRVASDPAFLRRFRDLHPPRLLGFYLNTRSYRRLEFVPLLPQPPELAAVLRRGCFSLDAFENSFAGAGADGETSSDRRRNGLDCRNGRLLFGLLCGSHCTYGVHSPLHPARRVVTVPAPLHRRDLKDVVVSDVLSKEVGDELSYFWFSFLCDDKGKATAYFHTLHGDAWLMNASAEMKIPKWSRSKQYLRSFLAVDDKIFTVATVKYIVVFNSTSSSFSTINFPDGMSFDSKTEILLSQGHDSGLYLLHSKGLKLSIWLYQNVNSSTGNWLLLDSFDLHDMCADLRMLDCEAQDGRTNFVYLTALGDNAEFVFFNTDAFVFFYLDVRSRMLHKVYEIMETDEEKGDAVNSNIHILPFMMIWPPTFPALKE